MLKEAPLDDLVRAIKPRRRGTATSIRCSPVRLPGPSVSEHVPELTVREREVLRLLADGLSNEEIGKRLFISAETVRTHLRKAMDKLGAETRTQAVAVALRDQHRYRVLVRVEHGAAPRFALEHAEERRTRRAA